ncbi:MAG: CIA30 family protein [bacterium]
MTEEERTLVDFHSVDEGKRWVAVNDGVMGGVSSGGFVVAESIGVFTGRVSLENNGGFASVRRRSQDYAMEGATGFLIRVKGDGKVYRFRVKTDDAFDGVFYQSAFETRDGEWTEHRLAFSEFHASFRGRTLDAPPIDPRRIRQIGFLIAEKQEGTFRLQVDWIKAIIAIE